MQPGFLSADIEKRNWCSTKHVAILMATYQGVEYLTDQLDSIENQTFENWTLWVSDDGSVDGTKDILTYYQNRWGKHRLQWFDGPGQGFALNFLSLICNDRIKADYYALADQDDIWLEDKLSRAVSILSKKNLSELPALYCSRTLLVDKNGKRIGLSAGLRRSPGFANAMVQNIASGNTMVFNHKARMLTAIGGASVDIPLHDWWLYIVVSGCGGYIYFDNKPGVLYRQHDSNVIGMRQGINTYPSRIWRILHGKHALQIERNLQALLAMNKYLSAESKVAFETFYESRCLRGIKRLKGMLNAGVYRQTLAGQMAMLIGGVFNKT